jgi:hypothetical protein
MNNYTWLKYVPLVCHNIIQQTLLMWSLTFLVSPFYMFLQPRIQLYNTQISLLSSHFTKFNMFTVHNLTRRPYYQLDGWTDARKSLLILPNFYHLLSAAEHCSIFNFSIYFISDSLLHIYVIYSDRSLLNVYSVWCLFNIALHRWDIFWDSVS